ncbi:vacuolar ATP synthase subunit D1 [Pyronema omphalodes]|nr:vacuolar ATP synthase subunit D1 [Pyronema omphalodes]
MEGLFFNVDSGYIEGIVRGYRNSLLTSQNYNNLTQCETLDDLKLQLAPSYGDVLNNVPSPLKTSTIATLATSKLHSEFLYLRSVATGTLRTFMDYLQHGYMIDNVALLITGTLHELDTSKLISRCHPLGLFEGLSVLCVATNVDELYNTILVETPLKPYFKGLTNKDLDELNIEIIRNTLYKNYLEHFAEFCRTAEGISGSPCQEIMEQILNFEADRRAINITLNSFGTELSKDERKKLYPEMGKLYPVGTHLLGNAESNEAAIAGASTVSEYADFFKQATMMGQQKSLEDLFYKKEMEIMKEVFTQQFTYAVVYAWLKLKEQEIRNITWIAECIAQNQKDRIGNYISIF